MTGTPFSSPVGPRLVALAAAALLATACADAPTELSQAPTDAVAAVSNAPFVTWHQGFEQDAAGWYDGSAAGALGWCGQIERVQVQNRGRADVAPSAGRRYAEVSLGFCNDYWTAAGLPFGGPYAPGPDGILLSDRWPEAGYVTELDLFLDPAWSGAGYESSFSTLDPLPYPTTTIINLGATIFETDYVLGGFHPAPHWFVPVNAVPAEAALDVVGHRIETAGWYTFRFVFSGEDGVVEVAFELRSRQGQVLHRVPLGPKALAGPYQLPFDGALQTRDYGSGHIWFFDIAPGLSVPIDEHRVRPGR